VKSLIVQASAANRKLGISLQIQKNSYGKLKKKIPISPNGAEDKLKLIRL
jgi:hypothetical protein